MVKYGKYGRYEIMMMIMMIMMMMMMMAVQNYATLPQFRRGATSGLHRTCFTQGRGGKIMKNRHVWKQ